MSAKSNAPVVIIKRKKIVGGDGHHGGAWKVAYADFVTAMMAFFMLMWLLNATTEKQRKGIADYFNPTIPVNRVSGGGTDAFGGDSVFTEQQLARNGNGASQQRPTDAQKAMGPAGAKSDKPPPMPRPRTRPSPRWKRPCRPTPAKAWPASASCGTSSPASPTRG